MNENDIILKQQLTELYQDLVVVNKQDIPKELGYEPTPQEVRNLDRGVTAYYNKILDIEDRLSKILDNLNV